MSLQVRNDFAFSLFDLDWDVFAVHIEGACNRVPAIAETGIKSTVCGPGISPSDISSLILIISSSHTTSLLKHFGCLSQKLSKRGDLSLNFTNALIF